MNRCAVAGFCSAGTFSISCTATSIFASDVIRFTRSLDLKILRRRFSAVAYDLELDLLAFIERGKTRLLYSRNVHKHIAPAALRLDKSIAFGRIKPLHSPGRHQSSPRVNEVNHLTCTFR